MSKMGQWVFGLQEDAMHMTFSQFVDTHGTMAAEIWHEVRFGNDRDVEPEYEPLEMDDGA